jgi:hypothetical protein
LESDPNYSVFQELMFKAARMARHARRWVLGLGANDGAFAAFQRHWRELDNPSTARGRILALGQGEPKPTRLRADRWRHPQLQVRLHLAVWRVGCTVLRLPRPPSAEFGALQAANKHKLRF